MGAQQHLQQQQQGHGMQMVHGRVQARGGSSLRIVSRVLRQSGKQHLS